MSLIDVFYVGKNMNDLITLPLGSDGVSLTNFFSAAS